MSSRQCKRPSQSRLSRDSSSFVRFRLIREREMARWRVNILFAWQEVIEREEGWMRWKRNRRNRENGGEREFLTGGITLISTLYGSTNCQRAITSANNADTIALINLLWGLYWIPRSTRTRLAARVFPFATAFSLFNSPAGLDRSRN